MPPSPRIQCLRLIILKGSTSLIAQLFHVDITSSASLIAVRAVHKMFKNDEEKALE